MKRLFSLTLAVAVLGTWFVPNSANAGILQRLFGYRGSSNAVMQPAQTETDTYRRGSYEPNVGSNRSNQGSPSSSSHRSYERKKAPWEYSKADPRRYSR
jgi:hypothetical protein